MATLTPGQIREQERLIIQELQDKLSLLESHYLINGPVGGHGKMRAIKGLKDVIWAIYNLKDN